MIRKVYTAPEEFHGQNKALGLHLPYSGDLSVFGTVCVSGSKYDLSGSPTVWPARQWRAVTVRPRARPVN